MARMAMNVRTVVGIDGDPRVLGALLHPSMDLIVGAIQGTPAAGAGGVAGRGRGAGVSGAVGWRQDAPST
jgi:hypothetical protein